MPIFKLILYNVFHGNGMQFYFTMTLKKKNYISIKDEFHFFPKTILLYFAFYNPLKKKYDLH